MRRVLVIAFVLLVAVAAPASAAPDNSPVFEEQTFLVEGFWLPNPCLGDDVWEPYRFEGRLVVHEFENPSGKEHLNDIGMDQASSDACLIQEHGDKLLVVAELWQNAFDGDFASKSAQSLDLTAIDLGHTSGGQLGDKPVLSEPPAVAPYPPDHTTMLSKEWLSAKLRAGSKHRH